MGSKQEVKFFFYEGYERAPIIERLLTILRALPDNKDWEIGIRRKVRQRSLDQNNLMHAIFNDVAAITGDHPAKVKEDFKEALGIKIASTGIDGTVREINKPTETYEVEEMTAFITRIIALCDDIGIDVATHAQTHRNAVRS